MMSKFTLRGYLGLVITEISLKLQDIQVSDPAPDRVEEYCAAIDHKCPTSVSPLVK